MKKVLHVSSECYPAAKAGGMGDVVGALPGYLPSHGILASVVIPKYKGKWIDSQKFKQVYEGSFSIDGQTQKYNIQKLEKGALAFPFFCIDLPGLFDRESIYLGADGHGYKDEAKRNIAFQTAVLEWLSEGEERFDLIHVHDHMTGLIPFFMQHGHRYEKLKKVPSVLTIHNGAYRGEFLWHEVISYFPKYDNTYSGLLDWDGRVNSLAAAIKCAWSINTVSPTYMQELIYDSDTLTPLYKSEIDKCLGIINGIDNNLWDPKTDAYLTNHFQGDWKKFKAANKTHLLNKFDLIKQRPTIAFIGRFAHQKGADLLIEALRICLERKIKICALILGSGDKALEEAALKLSADFPREIGVEIAYDESLARHFYAGSDFLMMPSRFEPCGLNQMYAMRYGTIPIASQVGGLKDTVADISENGQGIVINALSTNSIVDAIIRAVDLYQDKKTFSTLIESISSLDYSWTFSAGLYAKLYSKHIK